MLNDKNIHKAVADWLEGGEAKNAAENRYGSISSWDVKAVTDMSCLFSSKSCGTSEAKNFDDDINDWDASRPAR